MSEKRPERPAVDWSWGEEEQPAAPVAADGGADAKNLPRPSEVVRTPTPPDTNFDAFFRRATGGHEPHPYQRALATRARLPARLEIPTGLGKTQAVLAAWLWRRCLADAALRTETPRRLVYCLPMRVLVTQTEGVARAMIERAGLDVRVRTLLGGETAAPEAEPWDIYPETDTVLIGTQDMLLSRALNRGYAMSRYRWPIPFGLLNNDCLWVVDEPQLLGAGLPSTAQLDAFRRRRFPAFGPTGTMWLSATLDRGWLKTVDVEDADLDDAVTLDEDDTKEGSLVEKIRNAPKRVARADCKPGDATRLAKLVREHHRDGTRTLVIVNTVRRAREVLAALRAAARPRRAGRGKGVAEAPTSESPRLVLLHSQFRPLDRRAREAEALAAPGAAGTIVVSTQVVEAGVDMTSSTLFTDLAPWASLVQRFGRCNRRAEDPSGRIFWIDISPKASDKECLPYDVAGIAAGRLALETLGEDGSPAAITAAAIPLGAQPLTHVIRARDALDLFDTTPDLSGADVDVSRFIREADDRDVHVFWRAVEKEPGDDLADPDASELCSAPLADLRQWLKSKRAWRWDLVEEAWVPLRADGVFPGLEILLRSSDGGYDPETGWSPEAPGPVPVAGQGLERVDRREGSDPLSTKRKEFQTLAEHSTDVADRASRLAQTLLPPGDLRELFVRAARYHDAGKAHEVFQRTMDGPAGGPWAKSERNRRHERKGFRHELVSALMALETGEPDLLAYLVASHHGKVRMRIRSNPNEKPPADRGRLFAKGVWQGEKVGPVNLGGGLEVRETTMNLEYMLMGESPTGTESWTSRVIRLRDDPGLGPFRLAYLEALLRAADERASARLP